MPVRILIVEDEIIVAQDIRMTLEKLGYEVIDTVDTGARALSVIERDLPDLILMDIRIKGDMDGVETAKIIRSRVHRPIIFLTAYADEATIDRAKLAEPFGYLVKPVQERDIRTTIEIALYNHRIEQQAREQREWLRITLRSIGDGVIATDAHGRVTFMNPTAEKMTEWTEAEAIGKRIEVVASIRDGNDARPLRESLETILSEGRSVRFGDDSVLVSRQNRRIPIMDSGAPIMLPNGRILGAVFVFQDVTEKRRYEQEREMLLTSLQQARTEVKSLRELIPICSVCKKIRDDEGYWQEVEEYISEQTDASFTHGICPDCLKKLYPEYADEVDTDY